MDLNQLGTSIIENKMNERSFEWWASKPSAIKTRWGSNFFMNENFLKKVTFGLHLERWMR